MIKRIPEHLTQLQTITLVKNYIKLINAFKVLILHDQLINIQNKSTINKICVSNKCFVGFTETSPR